MPVNHVRNLKVYDLNTPLRFIYKANVRREKRSIFRYRNNKR